MSTQTLQPPRAPGAANLLEFVVAGGAAPANKIGKDPLEKVRAYYRMAGVSVDPPPLPVTLVPAASRQALFRALLPLLGEDALAV